MDLDHALDRVVDAVLANLEVLREDAQQDAQRLPLHLRRVHREVRDRLLDEKSVESII